jgi:type I restriction enzyme, S subunit
MEKRIKEIITEKISGEWGEEASAGEGVPVIRTVNFTNEGIIDFGKIVYRKIDTKKIKEKRLRKGDIIIEKSGGSLTQPVGRVVYFDLETNEDYLCNNFTSVLRPDTKQVYPKYLFYQLFIAHSRGRTLKYQNKTTGIINLKLDNYLAEKIHVPSLTDQIRIATVLSKAEALINQRKEGIRLLDEYIKAVFLEMFGDPVRNEKKWEMKTIEGLVKTQKHSIKRGPFGGALKKEIFVSKGYLVYEQFHALNNDFTFERYYIDERKFEELKAFEVLPGDIIISCSGIYLGKLAIVPKNAKQGIINQALLKISLDNNIISSQFFVYLFSHDSFKNKFYGSSIGSGIPNFPPMQDFKKFKFIYPPIKLQKIFALIVEKIELLKNQSKESLHELENLFASLSQRAFKGEIDLSRIQSKAIDAEIEKAIKDSSQKKPVETKPQKPVYEDTSYGDPFDVDEATAKKQGVWFYNLWLGLHKINIEDEQKSVWLHSRKNGMSPATVKFTEAEGNAVINEILAKNFLGFSYQELAATLKNEKITYTSKELKNFIFQKLEQKQLVQYYASKEWVKGMLSTDNSRLKQEEESTGDGSIWFFINKTEQPG